MKLGVFAASTLIGLATLTPASFAQEVMEMSRTSQTDMGDVMASRSAVTPGPAPTLQGVRPTLGMLPVPAGPAQGRTGEASTAPIDGGDIRQSLRRE